MAMSGGDVVRDADENQNRHNRPNWTSPLNPGSSVADGSDWRLHSLGRAQAASQPAERFMIPWSLLETAQVPDGSGELRLMRRGAEFSIRLGHNELMNSRLGG